MKKILMLVLISMMSMTLTLSAAEKKVEKKGGCAKPSDNFEVNMKDKGMFVFLTTKEPAKSGVATALATKTLIRGGNATIVLSGSGLKLALKKGKLEKFPPKGSDVREMLKEFLKKGGKVIVCAMCAKHSGITQKDLVEGIQLQMSDRVLEQMYQANWKILSF
jgi:predicted peroxiredoxin